MEQEWIKQAITHTHTFSLFFFFFYEKRSQKPQPTQAYLCVRSLATPPWIAGALEASVLLLCFGERGPARG